MDDDVDGPQVAHEVGVDKVTSEMYIYNLDYLVVVCCR